MSDVEEIKSRIDIADIIGEYIQLKPSGANMKAQCPFHEEKSASFMVHRGKQIWHCFGCNVGGDVFSFLQKIENIEFTETLRMLADKAGIQLKGFDKKQYDHKSRLKDLNTLATSLFSQLLESPEGDIARNYLINERNITQETIDTFKLGVAPMHSWERLVSHLKGKGHSDTEIIESGLGIAGKKGAYDRFRARIMFPIHDSNNQVIGFTGRLLPKNEDKDHTGKYVNTPETPIFHKSQVLYGLNLAKKVARETNSLILVEGQMDVLASHQAGVKHVIAGSGTALSQDQLRLISRTVPQIIFALDTDSAGEQALIRGVQDAWSINLEVLVIDIPKNYKDPADIVRENKETWIKISKKPIPFMDYYLKRLLNRYDSDSREGKKNIAKHAIPLLTKIPDPIERSHYISNISDKLQVAENYIVEAIQNVSTKKDKHIQTKHLTIATVQEGVHKKITAPERISELILSIGIKYPDLFSIISESITPDEFTNKQYSSFYTDLHSWYNNKQQNRPLNSPNLLNEEKDNASESADILATLELLAEKEFVNLDPEQIKHELTLLLKVFKKTTISIKLKSITTALRQVEGSQIELEELQNLTTQFKTLTQELKCYE